MGGRGNTHEVQPPIKCVTAARIIARVPLRYHSDWQNGAQWNSLAFRAIGLLMVTALAELIAFPGS